MRPIVTLDFPLFIKWYVTTKCNLRCTHCYLTKYDHKENLDRMLPVADFLVGNKVQGVVLIGGEPLVRNDLEEIVLRLAEGGIKLKIATNGTLATRERANSLIRSGARVFQVSVEGPTSIQNDKVRGQGSFESIFAGCRELVRAGGIVTLAFTVSRQNTHRISEMFHLANTVGIQKIKFNAFIPIGTGGILTKTFSLTPEICRFASSEIEKNNKIFPHISIEAGAFYQRISFLRSTGPTFGCGAGTSTLVINSDFTLSACDMSVETDRTSEPIKEPEDIRDFWKNHILFKKWRGEFSEANKDSFEDFSQVHQNGCNLAYNAYRANVFDND
jgi:MoaA/NifB/PqqE/SkfB family radical SAM enzyme